MNLKFDTGTMTESAPVAWQEISGRNVPVPVSFRQISEYEAGFETRTYNPEFPLIIDPVLTWNTFMGSSYDDSGNAIAVDSSGNVYVTGDCYESWGAPVNPYGGARDAYAAKFNSLGELQWNTFMGSSSNNDYGIAIAVDGSGNVYVAGDSYTSSWGSPVNAHAGISDSFAAKLNSSGHLQWHTFMGSSSEEYCSGIAVDGSGNVYVTGRSETTWGSPVQTHAGGYDTYVAGLNSSGVLQWNTFVGSSSFEKSYGIAIDVTGNVYVTGESYATWGSPVNAYTGGFDAFTVRLNSSGALLWHTFMGGASSDKGTGIAIDDSGNVYVAGESYDSWGTPVNAHVKMYDAFVVKFSPTPPVVETIMPSSINANSASAGGNVTDNGGVSVIVKGVCWSKSENPTLSDNYTEEGPGIGTFESVLADLEPSTTYHVRAYATNNTGTAFGEDLMFTTSPPNVSFTSASQSADENAGAITITGQLSTPSFLDVAVLFAVTGTATGGGADYTITESPLTIPAGSTTGTVTITLNDDSLDEQDEFVVVSMGALTNANHGANTTHMVTIMDNDAPPTVSFTSTSQAGAENEGSIVITAQLNSSSNFDVDVPFTVSGSATGDGTDYSITASPVTIPAGATTQTITITLNNDGLDENDETVVVTMGSPINATQGAIREHVAFITDNETDSDGDGMSDAWETAHNLNPDEPGDGDADNDGDGLSNREEHNAGTNPDKKDSDGDTLSDQWELDNGLDPTSVDSDNNGTGDGNEDPDNDGIINIYEELVGTNPNESDSDNDGTEDGDEDPDSDGITTLDEIEKGLNPVINELPEAIIVQLNQSVGEAVAVTLNGSGSSDPDDGIESYLWEQIIEADDPVLALTDADKAMATFTTPQVTSGGQAFVFKLIVTDKAGQASSATCVVNVSYDNEAPVAEAGEPQQTTDGIVVELDGSDSSDSDGTIATYQWEQTRGTSVELTGADTATPSFTAPSVAAEEVLEFTLWITDNDGLKAMDTVEVLVAVLESATASSGGGGDSGSCFIDTVIRNIPD